MVRFRPSAGHRAGRGPRIPTSAEKFDIASYSLLLSRIDRRIARPVTEIRCARRFERSISRFASPGRRRSTCPVSLMVARVVSAVPSANRRSSTEAASGPGSSPRPRRGSAEAPFPRTAPGSGRPSRDELSGTARAVPARSRGGPVYTRPGRPRSATLRPVGVPANHRANAHRKPTGSGPLQLGCRRLRLDAGAAVTADPFPSGSLRRLHRTGKRLRKPNSAIQNFAVAANRSPCGPADGCRTTRDSRRSRRPSRQFGPRRQPVGAASGGPGRLRTRTGSSPAVDGRHAARPAADRSRSAASDGRGRRSDRPEVRVGVRRTGWPGCRGRRRPATGDFRASAVPFRAPPVTDQ